MTAQYVSGAYKGTFHLRVPNFGTCENSAIPTEFLGIRPDAVSDRHAHHNHFHHAEQDEDDEHAHCCSAGMDPDRAPSRIVDRVGTSQGAQSWALEDERISQWDRRGERLLYFG